MRVVIFGLSGLAILVALLWLDHTRQTTLPVPTGKFAVGRTTYEWSGAKREIFAWIWYPAPPRQPGQVDADYLPAPWRKAMERHGGVLMSKILTRDLSKVHAHSTRGAPVSRAQPAYPVVIMRAGLAALTTDYTSLAEDLASHGYVVVGFDAPSRSMVVVFPDGRVVERAAQNDADLLSGSQQKQLAGQLVKAWTADMGLALDQLERLNASDASGRFLGRLDMRHVGIFGHSLGGATALQFCHDDLRCKAGIDVDGAPLGNVITDGVMQPFLFILSDHTREPASETGPVMADIHAIYDRLPGYRRRLITMDGANHFMFSDNTALLKSPPIVGTLHALGIVRMDGRRQIDLTAHYMSSFFDHYLQGVN